MRLIYVPWLVTTARNAAKNNDTINFMILMMSKMNNSDLKTNFWTIYLFFVLFWIEYEAQLVAKIWNFTIYKILFFCSQYNKTIE